MTDLDITKKIKIIEQLKSQMLSDMATLYANMASDVIKPDNNVDVLADMVILSYLLSEKFGVSYDGMDIRIRNKLKLALVQEDEGSLWRSQLRQLAKYFQL